MNAFDVVVAAAAVVAIVLGFSMIATASGAATKYPRIVARLRNNPVRDGH